MTTLSLRVEAHPRGHVAACNGRVELVGARVEPHVLQAGGSCLQAQVVQAKAEETRREKESRLLTFQREVKERVQRRERVRQEQLSEAVRQRETREVERATRLKKRRMGQAATVEEREVVAVMVEEPSSTALRARQCLLAASRPTSQPHSCAVTAEHTPQAVGTAVPDLPHSGRIPDSCGGSRTPPLEPPLPSRTDVPMAGRRSAMGRCVTPARLKQARKQSQAQQCRMFHKLYSDLERETVRQRKFQRALQTRVERVRREKELDRRAVEEELHEGSSLCSISTSAQEARERMEEWEETVALERRRHQLQTARELERYVEALRARLRERLSGRQTHVPPLCSCTSSLWDTDPQNCANNCPFYKNPKAYAKALTNLLASLEH